MSKLLIADCYPEVTKSLKDFFTAMGLSTQIANNAKEIVNNVEKIKPNIVIMDIRLNNEKRWDIVEKIEYASPNTKIIIMSTYNESEIMDELSTYNIRNYVSKPIDVKRLLDIVKKELGEI